MNTGRSRGLAAMLTLALGAGTVAGAGLLGAPAWAAGELTGTYTLDSTGIWTGQQVTLTESELVDGTPDSVAERTVDWGDGSPVQALAAGATKATHKYAAVGSYPVTVKLSDADGEGTATITNAPATVQVSTAIGGYKFAVASNWTWKGGGATAKLLLSGVPATATRVWVDWGDGKTSLLGPKTAATTHYYPVGTHAAKVTLENAQGRTAPVTTRGYTVKVDTTKPTSTLTVPGKPTRASSWKTIQGTAKDGQLGMDSVGVQLWKWTATKDYYFNFSSRKWVRYTPGKTKIPDAAVTWRGVDAKGVWRVPVPGLGKGYTIEVDYVAVDRAGNDNGWKYKVQKLTS
jgi:5'-nucleotidase